MQRIALIALIGFLASTASSRATDPSLTAIYYADAPNTSAPCLYLAIGIYYGSSCEGVLLCQLSLQALSGTHGIDESLTHGYLQLLRDGTAIASFGHPVEGFSKEIAIPELGLSLRYTNSDTAQHCTATASSWWVPRSPC